MASSRALLLTVAISALLFLHGTAFAAAAASASADDEDLSFLEDGDVDASIKSDVSHGSDDAAKADAPGDEPVDSDDGSNESPWEPAIDESDVIVLTGGNFSEFVGSRKHVMVEFYAPWCGHCKELAPEYAAAATALRGEDVALAKVDGTKENYLGEKYVVEGFPTVMFFVDGVHREYPGARSKGAIVTWIKKKIGPLVQNVTSVEAAKKILAADNKVVLGFLDSLVGADSDELAAASTLEDEVFFYQTASPDVAKLFHIDPSGKRPALVLLKKEEEKVAYFDGKFTESPISDFVSANKLPLVITFTRDSTQAIFGSSIKKQILLFASSNESGEVVSIFQEAAKLFKGKLIFAYVKRDNEDIGVMASEYFGATEDRPQIVGHSGNEAVHKYMFDGDLSVDNIKKFAEDFLEGKLQPFYNSQPLPETNDGDVKIVVGLSFDEIVLDESKDVLLEIYAPWCGHCQALEPIYNKIAKHLRGVDSLVIAKLDGTKNEHPRAKADDGFPTLLFFPAGRKSSDPIAFDGERTVVGFYKFLRKHAAIPFKLTKPDSAAKSEGAPKAPELGSAQSSSSDLKDEL